MAMYKTGALYDCLISP